MAVYSEHWESFDLCEEGTDYPVPVKEQSKVYCWADFGVIRCARLRTIILLTTLLKEKYQPSNMVVLPEEVLEEAIKRTFLRVAEVTPPESVFTENKVKDIMKSSIQILDTIDPYDDGEWINELLDWIADQCYGLGALRNL